MQIKRKRRIYLVMCLIVGMGTATSLVLYALSQNINLYYTPQQVIKLHIPPDKIFRLGGMVAQGSVHRLSGTLQVNFVLTDYHRQIEVQYNGILPSLFRVGQGIVAQGELNSRGIFVADQVLAKHDSTYKPPAIGNKKEKNLT
jgi:cytochrome c-type biogenesis protein CcmE